MAQEPAPRRIDWDRLSVQIVGWAGLAVFLLTLHRMFMLWHARETWVQRGAIVSTALILMWLWSYGPRIWASIREWSRRGGANSAAVILGVVVVAVMLNYFAERRAVWRLDLTKNSRYSLAPQSKEIVKALDEPVTVSAFVTADAAQQGMRTQVEGLLDLYANAAPGKFIYTIKNPLADLETLLNNPPNFGGDLNGAIVTYQGRREDLPDFTERDLTSALIKLTRPTTRQVAVLQGHGELSIETGQIDRTMATAVDLLRRMQWEIEPLSLYGDDVEAPSPEEVAAIVIAGAEQELEPVEIERIEAYLAGGGRLLLMIKPLGPDFAPLLARWGIQPTRDLVLGAAHEQNWIILEPGELAEHAVTRNLGLMAFTPSFALKRMDTPPAGVTVTQLISSGERVRIAANYQKDQQLQASQLGPGPAILALVGEKEVVAATGDAEAKHARVIAVGNALFPSDAMLQLASDYNITLFTNMVNWLAEEDALVSIPPKDEQTDQVTVGPDQARLLVMVHYLDFPLLAALLGLLVYLKRR